VIAPLLVVAVALAQPSKEPTAPARPAGAPTPAKEPEKGGPAPSTAPPTSPATPAPTALPSLDEALGLTKPADKPKPTEPKPAVGGDLDRALSSDGPAGGGELERAVALMDRSAGALEKGADTSIDTQRMQEETVRLLDALIKKSGQKKQSSQQKQQNQQQRDQNQQQQPNQSQQSQSQQQQTPGGEPSDSPERGGTRNAQLRPGIEGARAAWGNLPQRIRQLLMQGSGDQFSKEYQRLTEEYYKRLGEQGN